MLDEESGSESSIEKEEVKNETLHVSNSNFLPCSWRKLLSISALTLFGFYFFTSRMEGGETERFSQNSQLTNKQIKAEVTVEAVTESNMKEVPQLIYNALNAEMKSKCGPDCCVYCETEGKNINLKILNAENKWVCDSCDSEKETIQLYFEIKKQNVANSKDELHLWKKVVSQTETDETDFSLTLGSDVASLGMLWVLPDQIALSQQNIQMNNAYLLCNFGDNVSDKLVILERLEMRKKPKH